MGLGGIAMSLVVLGVLNVAAGMIYTTDSAAVAATPAAVEPVVEEATPAEEVVAEAVIEEVVEEPVEVAQDTTAEETPADEPEEEAEEEMSFADMVANGDVAAGEKVFKKCSVCHLLGEGRSVGPNLMGVVGREKSTVEGFVFSDAHLALEGAWTIEDLDAYLTKPMKAVVGTKMTFPGLRKVEDRANVIAYLISVAEGQ